MAVHLQVFTTGGFRELVACGRALDGRDDTDPLVARSSDEREITCVACLFRSLEEHQLAVGVLIERIAELGGFEIELVPR